MKCFPFAGCLIGILLSGSTVLLGEEPSSPLVLGTPQEISKPPIEGLACLPGSRQVLVQTEKGLSTLDLATGKTTGTAKLQPFPNNLPGKPKAFTAFATNRGCLAVSDDGGKAFTHDGIGVYAYGLPLDGEGPKDRVANKSLTIVPLVGITHVGQSEFAFGLNTRGELFECRSTPGEADPRSGLVKTALPRVRVDILNLPFPSIAGGGRHVAIGGTDGRIQIWDAVAKTDLYPVGVEQVTSLSITRDGKKLAAMSYGKKAPAKGPRVQVVSLPDGKETASWNTTGRRVAFSSDGSVLAVVGFSSSARKSHIELCDASTGKTLQEMNVPSDSIQCFDFTPDSKVFVAGGASGNVYQWNVETGKPQGFSPAPPPSITSVAFAADGGFATLHSDSTVRSWGADGRMANLFTVQDGKATHVLRSRDGRTIYASGSKHDGTIRAYDATTGKDVRRLDLPGGQSVAIRLAESPDGKHLYAGVTGEGIVRISLESFKIVAMLKPKEPSPASLGGAASDISFAADSTMVTRDFDMLRIWNLKEDREIRSSHLTVSALTAGHPFAPVAISPNGQRFLTSSGGLSFGINDIKKVPLVGSLVISDAGNLWLTAMIFITDKTVALGDSSGKIRLVELDKMKAEGRMIGEHLGAVTSLAVSPDGKRLISGSADGSAKVWKLP